MWEKGWERWGCSACWREGTGTSYQCVEIPDRRKWRRGGLLSSTHYWQNGDTLRHMEFYLTTRKHFFFLLIKWCNRLLREVVESLWILGSVRKPALRYWTRGSQEVPSNLWFCKAVAHFCVQIDCWSVFRFQFNYAIISNGRYPDIRTIALEKEETLQNTKIKLVLK